MEIASGEKSHSVAGIVPDPFPHPRSLCMQLKGWESSPCFNQPPSGTRAHVFPMQTIETWAGAQAILLICLERYDDLQTRYDGEARVLGLIVSRVGVAAGRGVGEGVLFIIGLLMTNIVCSVPDVFAKMAFLPGVRTRVVSLQRQAAAHRQPLASFCHPRCCCRDAWPPRAQSGLVLCP